MNLIKLVQSGREIITGLLLTRVINNETIIISYTDLEQVKRFSTCNNTVPGLK